MNQSNPAQARRTLLIIYGALLWGALLMTAAALFVAPEGELESPGLLPSLRVVGIALAALSFVVPSTLLKKNFNALRASRGPDQTLSTELPAEFRQKIMTAGHTAFILSMAISEAVVIVGVAARFLGADVQEAAPFLAGGIFLMAMRLPNPDKFFAAYHRG